MRKVGCYLEVLHKPLCQHEGIMNQFGGRCDYPSMAAARKVKKEIQKKYWPVYVMKGTCPELLKL